MTAYALQVAVLGFLIVVIGLPLLLKLWWRRRLVVELRHSNPGMSIPTRRVHVQSWQEGTWSDYRRAARQVHASHSTEEIAP